VSVNWCVVVCCGVVRWVPIETELQVKFHLLLQTEFKYVYVNISTIIVLPSICLYLKAL
jgi:hypothetical protein